MKRALRCADVAPGCAAEVQADDEAEILQQAAEHAREAHGRQRSDTATLERVRAAIRTGRWRSGGRGGRAALPAARPDSAQAGTASATADRRSTASATSVGVGRPKK